MKKIIILGAGRVGQVMARDLNDDDDLEVTAADLNADNLENARKRCGCRTVQADLGESSEIRKTVDPFDLVIGALPGFMGFNALEAVIESGKPCVDISFMPEDPRTLNEKAAASGSVVVYDMGVQPGTGSLLVADSAIKLRPLESVKIMVGGLPAQKKPPWDYAAPFSPADVIEEYVRPARVLKDGKITSYPACSGIEHINFPGVGELEAFYSDGLRSMLDTIECSSMEEKTLRYPGYAGKILALRDSGFFETEAIEIDGKKVVPLSFTLALLKKAWSMDSSLQEFTALRIEMTGKGGKVTWQLLDRTDADFNETSMTRTTGFPAAITARLILDGTVSLEPGVHPPEALASSEGAVDIMLKELDRRGVHYSRDC